MLACLERSRGLHGAQRGDDHRHPALVVAGAGPVRRFAVARPALERRIGLEHRVEVRDQQQPLAPAAARVAGDEMAGAARRLHVDPLGLEAKLLEIRARPCRATASTPARFIVPLFWFDPASRSSGKRSRLLGVDGADHDLLGAAERGGGRAGEHKLQRKTRRGFVASWRQRSEPTRVRHPCTFWFVHFPTS